VADSTDNESIIEVVPKVLGQYLLDNVQGLREYYEEFPSAHERIRTPSVSIIAATTDFRPMAAPYKLEQGNIVRSQSTVQYVVGFYDFSLQVDLWTGSKEERADIFDAMFNALNPEITPMGLVLEMEEYFNQLCDYTYTGHNMGDSEERSQRDEWRVTLTVLASCKAIRDKKQFIIEDIELQSDISEQVLVTEE
jgi:hypothetical protein